MKIMYLAITATLLVGCAGDTHGTSDPLKPNIWRQEKMGEVAGCKVFRTIMTETWRLYVIHCGYQKDRLDPIKVFNPGRNCRMDRDENRRIRYSHYTYTISCNGRLEDQRKPGEIPKMS